MAAINERLFEGSHAKHELEDALLDADVPFQRIGWDFYDNSLELYGVPPDYRLSDAGRKVVTDAGFGVLYMNHTDKWETHYNLLKAPPSPGWRVSYPHKRNDGDPNIWLEDKAPAPWGTTFKNLLIKPK